ncbi:MAG: ferrous iron transport protein B, partial [Bacteroidetes bacterium HGW-Bacteroidetes-22]
VMAPHKNVEALVRALAVVRDAQPQARIVLAGSWPDAAYPPSVVTVAVVGNPNAGKTSLFNMLSGAHERVGNYSGVTVDAKEVHFRHGKHTINLIDLPGTYSITAYTPEEVFVRNFIIDKLPDVVLNVVDSSSLERNLYLTTQLIDMDIKVVMALNMFDELQKREDHLDYDALGSLTGIPMVPTVASKGRGMNDLLDKIIEVFEDRCPHVRHIHINYGQAIEKSVKEIQKTIKAPGNAALTDRVSSRYLALKLLEKDPEELKRIALCHNNAAILKVVEQEQRWIKEFYGEPIETIITDSKYGFINGALKETLTPGSTESRRNTEVIDTFLTHRLFGIPVFAALMWLMFQATFTIGSYPMAWIDSSVHWISGLIGSNMAEGMLKDLLIDGIIGGVGGVIVFLPNIVLLFLFISLMEDTGYMARAVFIMDKAMHRIGLHGKSVIPLLMGFGCTVPAIMATRTLENRNDRMITMLINPFMSCSARLPVYVLLITAFFPSHSGTVLFIIYSLGVLVAIGIALLLKKTLFRIDMVPFVMELPPYR